VILVISERPGELYLHSSFIVTSFTEGELDADAVLDDYRERGTMEGHIGEHQSVLDGRLSSASRPKSRIRNFPVRERSEPVDAERANAAALLLHGVAFNPLNTLRLVGGVSGKVDEPARLHLGRAREELLAVAGRVVASARRATLAVTSRTAALWSRAVERAAAAGARRRFPLTPTTRPAAVTLLGGKGAVRLGWPPGSGLRASAAGDPAVRRFVNKAGLGGRAADPLLPAHLHARQRALRARSERKPAAGEPPTRANASPRRKPPGPRTQRLSHSSRPQAIAQRQGSVNPCALAPARHPSRASSPSGART
jgi:hypothetical protein